jgi:DNA polymerase-3 subunit epsilon
MKLKHKSLVLLSKKGLPAKQLEAELDEPVELSLELFKAQGLELVKRDDKYYYATVFTDLDEAEFCIVDIETNGSKPEKHQIIEIGAVKIRNKTIIDTFESLVQCDNISEHITAITGICEDETLHAPPLKAVMERFSLFLDCAVFVAHDVKFDYSFISAMMQRVGLQPLLNRSLCTIDIAERTIASYRYGLAYLNEQLGLYEEATHHRALSDAITTTKLFKRSLNHLPHEIKSAEDLVRFSKEAKRLKRPKLPVDDKKTDNKKMEKERE